MTGIACCLTLATLSYPIHGQPRRESQADPLSAHDAGWLVFRNYSHAYYPDTDDLVCYLRDWTEGISRGGPASGRPRPERPLASVT